MSPKVRPPERRPDRRVLSLVWQIASDQLLVIPHPMNADQLARWRFWRHRRWVAGRELGWY